MSKIELQQARMSSVHRRWPRKGVGKQVECLQRVRYRLQINGTTQKVLWHEELFHFIRKISKNELTSQSVVPCEKLPHFSRKFRTVQMAFEPPVIDFELLNSFWKPFEQNASLM
uniref:Uncharacterized protein n=1 Tax=Paramoeba aestuarina TaxID=180227 RepID=A0A7S4KGP9_9EUKA